MSNYIRVATGEVKMGGRRDILSSTAIGSCIVVSAIDFNLNIGVMAHVMLPGTAPSNSKKGLTKYAVNAIDKMLDIIHKNNSTLDDVHFCLVGGGNVLIKEDDTICENNIKSVTEIFKKKHLKVSAKALGGILRRSVRLHIENVEVYYTEGESKEMLLWSRSLEW